MSGIENCDENLNKNDISYILYMYIYCYVVWKILKQFLSLFRHNATAHFSHPINAWNLQFGTLQRVRFSFHMGRCSILSCLTQVGGMYDAGPFCFFTL